MNDAPTTRPRHALRWVLGVGLVFVAASAMTLQAARHRADERWNSVVAHCNEEWVRSGVPKFVRRPGIRARAYSFFEDSGGNILREWRQTHWQFLAASISLRQERSLLGSHIDARMLSGGPDEVEAARDIFAAVDIELIVEP